ncbi:MAG TPA: helix-turn-helix domain-containing protein [Nevskiaceae bacterium]|nr:helix-turn-helix domain-containing protein [Nevskiaceae bacterium]
MRLLDLLGRRWVMRVIWELRGDALGFRELQAACGGMSPSVLNQRLAELQDALIVEAHKDGRYQLTARGKQLLKLFGPLNRWAESWGKALR